jgi:hypothetical protein
MVQLSIVIFFGLFAIVEIYQSVKNVQLPMPVYLALGITLAVVSNLSVLNLAQNSNEALRPSEETLVLQEEAQVVPSIE